LKEQNTSQVKAKLLIVDDHPIVCQGLAQVVNLQPDMHACCSASNSDEALAAMRNCQHDLVIVDLSLQGTSGLSLISTLLAYYPSILILVMSMHEESIYAERALRKGAKGYIMKQQAVINIQTAIRKILNGGVYLSDNMQKLILDRVVTGDSDHLIADPTACLTSREYEVLRLIGFGLGTRQIAEKLKRSVKTVEAHRANIKEKLGIKTGLELIRYATVWVNDQDL